MAKMTLKARILEFLQRRPNAQLRDVAALFPAKRRPVVTTTLSKLVTQGTVLQAGSRGSYKYRVAKQTRVTRDVVKPQPPAVSPIMVLSDVLGRLEAINKVATALLTDEAVRIKWAEALGMAQTSSLHDLLATTRNLVAAAEKPNPAEDPINTYIHENGQSVGAPQVA